MGSRGLTTIGMYPLPGGAAAARLGWTATTSTAMRAVPLDRMAAASIRPFSGAAAAQIGLACKRATMIPPPYSFSFLVSSSSTSGQRHLHHRRGYAIMDRYRKINHKNDGQAPGA